MLVWWVFGVVVVADWAVWIGRCLGQWVFGFWFGLVFGWINWGWLVGSILVIGEWWWCLSFGSRWLLVAVVVDDDDDDDKELILF